MDQERIAEFKAEADRYRRFYMDRGDPTLFLYNLFALALSEAPADPATASIMAQTLMAIVSLTLGIESQVRELGENELEDYE